MSNNRRDYESPRAPYGGFDLIRELVRSGDYDFTEKVRQLIEEGWFDEADIERCIETGDVRKKETDELETAIDGFKYTIYGFDCAGCRFYCVGKVLKGEDGRLFLVITAHERKGS